VQPGLPEVISTAVKTPVNLLTRREQEIAQLLLAGYSSPRIAAMLEIKLNTVKAHNKNIYGKLGINSRPELFIKYADRI
jgi:DNA-binding NarL/FixJ family response regulator